jgi:hypothetical protein
VVDGQRVQVVVLPRSICPRSRPAIPPMDRVARVAREAGPPQAAQVGVGAQLDAHRYSTAVFPRSRAWRAKAPACRPVWTLLPSCVACVSRRQRRRRVLLRLVVAAAEEGEEGEGLGASWRSRRAWRSRPLGCGGRLVRARRQSIS